MLPSLKNLQYLSALEKTMHFSRAAKLCYVSASTFSAGIAKLEQDLQVQLVERTNKTVVFTNLGKKIVKQANLIIESATGLVELSKLDFFESELTIGVIPTISTYLLPNYLKNLTKKYPKLKVSFVENTSDNLIQMLDRSTIDFAIFAFPFDVPSYIDSAQVFSDPLYYIKPVNHKDSAIGDGELLLLEQGHCLRSHILNSQSISSAQISDFSCTSISTLIAMVDMGIGVSFLPKMAVDSGVLSNYPNIIVETNNQHLAREVGVVYRKTNLQKTNIKTLAELLVPSF